MLPTLIRWAARPAKPLFDFANNPYKARSIWPPDFDRLSPKQQFKYERTYRRRAKLKWARPTWTKGTKIVQWALIIGVVGYSVFLPYSSEDQQKSQPFQSAREWMKGTADYLWSPGATKESREAIAQAESFRRARDEAEQQP